VGLERAYDELRREFLAHVEHMRTHRARGQRAIADVFEHTALSEVERDGNHLGAAALAEPWNRDTRVERTREGENDLHASVYGSSRLVSAAARLLSRPMMRIVSSPAMVPTASCS